MRYNWSVVVNLTMDGEEYEMDLFDKSADEVVSYILERFPTASSIIMVAVF